MSNGIVTISFDDGSSGWILAADVLEKHGYRGTFNTCVRFIRKREPPFLCHPPDRSIHEAELIDLQRRGHEIGSHGVRHVNLMRCNSVELHHEVAVSKEILESLGLKIKTFSCPFNAASTKVKKKILNHYDNMRHIIGVNELPFTGITYKSVLGSDDMKAVIDRAVSENLWIVLLFHNVKENTTDKFSTDLEVFADIVQYASRKQLQGKTVSEMM